MNYQQYIEDCLRTESPYNFTTTNELVSPRLLHGVIGLVTETGELLDTIKKSLFYGKPLDKTNLIEELGDLLWYISLILKDCNLKDCNITYDELFNQRKYTDDLKFKFCYNIESYSAIHNDYYVRHIINLNKYTNKLFVEVISDGYFDLSVELFEIIRNNLEHILSDIYSLSSMLNISISDIMDININKLKLRYPDKFNSDQAINRDVDSERELLEQQVTGNEIGDIYQLLI